MCVGCFEDASKLSPALHEAPVCVDRTSRVGCFGDESGLILAPHEGVVGAGCFGDCLEDGGMLGLTLYVIPVLSRFKDGSGVAPNEVIEGVPPHRVRRLLRGRE